MNITINGRTYQVNSESDVQAIMDYYTSPSLPIYFTIENWIKANEKQEEGRFHRIDDAKTSK